MNARHRRTLAAIFDDPVRGNLEWSDIEAMLRGSGAEITEGGGSRIRVALGGIRAVFHRPHPRTEAGRGMMKSMRRFLTEAGLRP